MSILLSAAWVLGGILFLVSLIVVEAATGITNGLSESKETQKPWNIKLWQRVVTATFGPDLVVNNNDEDWRNFHVALDKAFPDQENENAEMLSSLVLSSAMSLCLGTIWWRAARLPLVYIGIVAVVAITGFVIYIYGALPPESLATRQIGILLRHKLEVEKKSDRNDRPAKA